MWITDIDQIQKDPIGPDQFLGLEIRALIPSKMWIDSDTHDVKKTIQLSVVEAHGTIHGGGRDSIYQTHLTKGKVFVNRIYTTSDYRKPHWVSAGWNEDHFAFNLGLNEYRDEVFDELRSATGRIVEIRIGTQGWVENSLNKRSLCLDGYSISINEPEPLSVPVQRRVRWWPFA